MAAPRTRDPEHAAALRRTLEAEGVLPRDATWADLPPGRTNRLWHVSGPERSVVVKLFDSDAATPLFRNDPRAEALVLKHLEGTGLAPSGGRLVATDFGLCLIYDHVPGPAWSGPPAQVARLLRRLHSVGLPTALPSAPDGSTEIAASGRAMLELCDDGPLSRRLADLVPERVRAGASGAAALLHGDPVPANIVQTPDGPVLIDWQCPSIGDPLHDVALFLSPSMQLLNRGRVLSAADVAAFAAAYDDAATMARYRALRPWLCWRLAVHCLWRGAERDPLQRAALEAECAQLTDA